jgi:hypothetical protein
MALAKVHNSLWTPEGEQALHEKNVVAVPPGREMNQWADLHFLADKYNLSIVCRSCNHGITGQNNDSSKILAVACQCREWRFVR